MLRVYFSLSFLTGNYIAKALNHWQHTDTTWYQQRPTIIILHNQDVRYTFVKPNSCVWQETQLQTEHDSICYLTSDLHNPRHLKTPYINLCFHMIVK